MECLLLVWDARAAREAAADSCCLQASYTRQSCGAINEDAMPFHACCRQVKIICYVAFSWWSHFCCPASLFVQMDTGNSANSLDLGFGLFRCLAVGDAAGLKILKAQDPRLARVLLWTKSQCPEAHHPARRCLLSAPGNPKDILLPSIASGH